MVASATDTISLMAETPPRPRMIFDCTERLRVAIKLRGLRKNAGPSDVIVSILEAALIKELEEADKMLAEKGIEPEPHKGKRGRKPKPKPPPPDA